MIGTLTVGGDSRRRSRGFTFGMAIGLTLPLALLVLSLLPRGSPSPGDASPALAAQRSALEAFETALEPVVDDGATTVVYGMRPGINDIFDGRFEDATLVTMASGWVDAMEGVRGRFAAIEAPAFLADAARVYAEAFDAYVETARALLAAAGAVGDARLEHVSRAAAAGNRADDLFDAAQGELGRHRDRLEPVGEPTGSG